MKMIIFAVALVGGTFLAWSQWSFQRDLRTYSDIKSEFNPVLKPIKDLVLFSSEEKSVFKDCLERKAPTKLVAPIESEYCRCYAVGVVKYVFPLMPNAEKPNLERVLSLYGSAPEIAAKGKVIEELCSVGLAL